MGFLKFFGEATDYFISDIRKQTGKGFIATFTDTGNYGEFLSYKYLINTPGKRDYIHNCYVPTENGYTEIDFILLHETGVYVVESKNYSGWIFGDEKSKYWTQVLAGGKTKNRFFNPVLQNAGHIKALKSFLKDIPDLRYYSLIVFSERCELKKVSCTLPDTYVVKRDALKSVFKKQIKEREKFPESMLYEIGQLLKPHCHITEAEKTAHVERIKGMNDGKGMLVGEPIAQYSEVENFGLMNLENVSDRAEHMVTAFNTDEETLVIDDEIVAHIKASVAAMVTESEVVNEMFRDAKAVDAVIAETITETADENEATKITTSKADIDSKEDVTIQICPRCHKSLVERKGKNGPFIGCTGFPHCRYTRNST